MKQVKIRVSGKVQGVSFRYYTCQQALKLNLQGYVKNLNNGDVEIVASGDNRQVTQLIEWARSGSPAAKVNNIEVSTVQNPEKYNDFTIRY